MTWEAVAERWRNEVILSIPSLPGFFAKEPDVAQAFARANETISPFVDWLVEDELLPGRPEMGPIVIQEELAGEDGKGPIFVLDRLIPEANLLELALAVGRAALSDLIFTFDDLDRSVLREGERQLRHVAEMDRWYANRIQPGLTQPQADLEDELVGSASFFEEIIDEVFGSDPGKERTLGGETWTLAKVLRRRTVHLREHVTDLLVLSQQA
jgi:hypothetical protein